MPTKTTNPSSVPFSKLNKDVLAVLVTHLTAPSAVSFALTSKTNLAIVLKTCQVNTLSAICPRDVRTPLPTAIIHNAYNLLLPKPRAYFADTGYRIAKSFIPNYLIDPIIAEPDTPDRDRRAGFLQIKFEALAYARRLAWMKPSEIDTTDMMGWNLVRGHVPHELLGSKAPSREFKGECSLPDHPARGLSTNSDSSVEYLRSHFNVLGMPQVYKDRIRGELGRVTSAGEGQVIESSEWMELGELLKGWGNIERASDV
jgi:hypothetical protein